MGEEIRKKLEEQEAILQEIYKSVEKTRRYFLWTLIITLIVIILPFIGLLFVLPTFLNSVTGGLAF